MVGIGSLRGVKLLFPLQMPAPHHPSCRSRRAAEPTCRPRTTSAAQRPPPRRPHHPPRGLPWPPLSPSPHPTTAWRAPWAPGAAATAPSAGRSPQPPVLRTTTMPTVPAAGRGRWRTNIPSTEPPPRAGWQGGTAHPRLVTTPASLPPPPPPATTSSSAAGTFPEPCERPATSRPVPAPRLGWRWGVWKAENISAISELAAFSLSLRTKSSPGTESAWGSGVLG